MYKCAKYIKIMYWAMNYFPYPHNFCFAANSASLSVKTKRKYGRDLTRRPSMRRKRKRRRKGAKKGAERERERERVRTKDRKGERERENVIATLISFFIEPDCPISPFPLPSNMGK